jgi:hypothetical protein
VAIVAPTPIPAGPPRPDPDNVDTFDALAYEFNRWEVEDLQPGVDATAQNVYANALEVQTHALAAQVAAAAAQAVSNAPAFNPATNYAQHAVAFSLVNGQTYRRMVAGVSATDPAQVEDGTWLPISQQLVVVADVSGAVVAQPGVWYRFTAAGSLTLPATPYRGNVAPLCKTSAAFNVDLLRNGKPIGGLAEDGYLGTPGIWYVLIYLDGTTGWSLVVS